MQENKTMNRFNQAERLLKAFKLDFMDEFNTSIALGLIDKYGDFTKVIHESLDDRYNRLRYTPDLLLQALMGKDTEDYESVNTLSEKLYALRNVVSDHAEAKGVDIAKMIDDVNVIETLQLSVEEAWTVYFVGGKSFILKMTNLRDGEAVLAKLKEAYLKAVNHLKETEKFKLTAQKTNLIK